MNCQFLPVSFHIYFFEEFQFVCGSKFYLVVFYIFLFFKSRKIEKPNWFKNFKPKTNLKHNINLSTSNSEVNFGLKVSNNDNPFNTKRPAKGNINNTKRQRS